MFDSRVEIGQYQHMFKNSDFIPLKAFELMAMSVVSFASVTIRYSHRCVIESGLKVPHRTHPFLRRVELDVVNARADDSRYWFCSKWYEITQKRLAEMCDHYFPGAARMRENWSTTNPERTA
jgi:hypothetical protein